MPFALVIIGLMLVVTGAKDTYKDFGNAVAEDMFGPQPNFSSWMLALGLIGALGYVEVLRPFSRIFMTLVIVVMVLRSNSGFFDRLGDAIRQGPDKSATADPLKDAEPSGGGNGKSANSDSDMFADIAKTAMMFFL